MQSEQHLPPNELIINNISRFITLNDDEKEIYLSLLQPKKVKKKGFLLRQGETAKYEFFIVKGCLKTYTVDTNGVEHVSMFGIEDWWTGDLYSFMTEEPSLYFIEALEDTEVLQISKPNFDLLFEKIPKFERFYRILYQKSLITYIRRVNHNISLTAEDRYQNFISKYPQIANRISQKNIAAYLGVTPEFVSMIRRKLSQK